jgi:hypothetical protein
MHNVSRHKKVQPLLQTRVVLKVISLVDDGNAVVVAASSGEEDLRRRKTVWRGDLCCGGRFHRWSSSAGADDGAAGV